MKFKSTWILIAIFAALGAYLYFVEEPSHLAAEKAKEKEGLLFPGFDPAKVNEVTIDGPKGKIRLKKGEKDDWTLVEPLEDRADNERVRSLLSDLKSLKSDREIESSTSDLAPYGLAKPQVVLTTKGSAVTLAIGSENPAGDSRYVRAGSGPVKLAKTAGVAGFLLPAKDLRNKDLVGTFPWSRLQSLEVHPASGAPIRLVKKDEAWRIEEPFSAEADSDAVESMTDKLRWARATSFVDEDPAKAEETLSHGLAVVLKAEGPPASETVRLARVGDQVWATAGDRKAVLAMSKDVFDAFQVSAKDLRRLKPVLTKSWSAETLDLSGEGKNLAYERKEGSWRRDGKPLAAAESSALKDLLSSLENTKATDVIESPGDLKSYGLSNAKLTLKLSDSRYKDEVLTLGDVAGKVYARSGASGPVYAMPPDYLAKAEALAKASSPPPKAAQKATKP